MECDHRLLPILKRTFPNLTLARRNTNDLAEARQPGCLKTSTSDLVGRVVCVRDDFCNPPGWLLPDTTKTSAFRAAYRHKWPGKLLAGISWRSFRPDWGPTHKSLGLCNLAPLLGLPDITWINLQYGDVHDEIAALGDSGVRQPYQDPTIDQMTDLDAFAAQVAALDLVITTSNTTAHMAGALGKPTVLMLQSTRGVFSYWCYEGDTTPWYPTVRIVRGDTALPLPDYLKKVASAVTSLITSDPTHRAGT